jgi:hypothetical protein
MAKSINKQQKVYVVTHWRSDCAPRILGVHPSKEDAERSVWNVRREINDNVEWSEEPALPSQAAWRGGEDHVQIQESDFPHDIFVKGWTEDHRQILSDGSIRTVAEYVAETDRYIAHLKNSPENEVALEYAPEVRRILCALGLPENTFVNDYIDLEELYGVTKESISAAAGELGIDMQPCDHVVGAARHLRDRDATFKSVSVGDYVKIFHPFGDGSYITMGQVLEFSKKAILIHERALDESYYDMSADPKDHRKWVGVDVWVPFERKGWYDPARYHISKSEDVPRIPADVEIELCVARSGVADHNGNMITPEAIKKAAEEFEGRVVETEHGAELFIRFNPKEPSATQIKRQKYA